MLLLISCCRYDLTSAAATHAFILLRPAVHEFLASLKSVETINDWEML